MINGTGYQADNGALVVRGSILFAFGPSNPTFTNPPATISGAGPSTAIAFPPAATSSKGGLIGITTLHLSGSQRIIQNQLNGLMLNGAKLGRTVAQTGLTGGYIVGTGYGSSGAPPTFTSFGTFGTAFGNSPLNLPLSSSPIIISALPNQPSYLNFLNKINIPLGSAQLYAQTYFSTGGTFIRSPGGPFVLTGGSNPLNIASTSTFTRTILSQESYIHLLSKFF